MYAVLITPLFSLFPTFIMCTIFLSFPLTFFLSPFCSSYNLLVSLSVSIKLSSTVEKSFCNIQVIKRAINIVVVTSKYERVILHFSIITSQLQITSLRGYYLPKKLQICSVIHTDEFKLMKSHTTSPDRISFQCTHVTNKLSRTQEAYIDTHNIYST